MHECHKLCLLLVVSETSKRFGLIESIFFSCLFHRYLRVCSLVLFSSADLLHLGPFRMVSARWLIKVEKILNEAKSLPHPVSLLSSLFSLSSDAL